MILKPFKVHSPGGVHFYEGDPPKPARDVETVRAEIEWCLRDGNYGPRTGVALRWALDVINDLARGQEALALPDSEGGEL